MQFLASLIGAVFGKLLAFLAARYDLKESTRKEIALESEKDAKKAYKWKSDNPVQPIPTWMRNKRKDDRLVPGKRTRVSKDSK